MAESDCITAEEWRDVPGFEGIYQVSSLGRIKRISDGSGTFTGRILEGSPSVRGYRRVTLTVRGKWKGHFVHRIVSSAFLGVMPPGLQVNHRNGIKSDNRIENLEYVTGKENASHAYETGLTKNFGENHKGTKFSDELIAKIRQAHSLGGKQAQQRELAKRFGVSKTQIARIVNGVSRKRGSPVKG